jgi:hypothetical protein
MYLLGRVRTRPSHRCGTLRLSLRFNPGGMFEGLRARQLSEGGLEWRVGEAPAGRFWHADAHLARSRPCRNPAGDPGPGLGGRATLRGPARSRMPTAIAKG